MKKRILSLCMVVALLLSMLPNSVLTARAETIASGTSKEGFRWELDSEGTLTISGTGPMKDYYPAGDGPTSWVDANLGTDYKGPYNDQVKRVVLSQGITSIGKSAFHFCKAITSIEIPDSVTSIGQDAFSMCTNLQDITIPKGVTTIDALAFAGSGLTSIIFPESISSIGFLAFSCCENLKYITFVGNAPTIGDEYMDVFEDVNATVYYPRNNPTWTADVMQNYGGILTWVSMDSLGNTNPVEENPSLFIPVVESRIAECKFDSLSAEKQQECRGILYDLDSDGNNELILRYVDKWNDLIFEVWKIQNGTPSCINTVNLFSGGIGTNGSLSSATYEGKRYLVYQWLNSGMDYVNDLSEVYCLVEGKYEYTSSVSVSDLGKLTTLMRSNYDIDKDEEPEGTVFDELISLLQSITTETHDNTTEDNSIPDEDSTFEDYTRSEWIDTHIDYANSEQFTEQVTPGFNGALDDALEDIKDNGMITAYNTLDSINTILDFDLDLTDEQEYEILLAQILFSRTGADSIDVIYDEYLRKNVLTICDLLIDKILPEMTDSAVKENIEPLKELRETLKGLVYEVAQYDEILGQIMDGLNDLVDLNDTNILDACAEACETAGLTFASDFLLNEFETASDALYHTIICMAAAEAYCNTSDAFGEMLIALRENIAIPSDDARFNPDMVSGLGVTDEKIWELLELKNADNSIGPDPLNTPVYLSALASAIENYYIQLEEAKAGNASTIAMNALAAFSEETLDNLVDAELNVVVSLFECLPVVKQFSAIKDMFDGTQFVIDAFTKIDSRAYLGSMVMRLYAISYIHYFTVDGLSSTDAWGMTGILLSESEFSKDEQYADAVLFDESIAVYRAILSVAAEYAEEYYTTYYETANSILDKYPSRQLSTPPYVNTDSDTFKSVKQKIIELQMQKNDLAYEWCHSSKIIFNQLHGVNTYDSSEMLLYSFKCPVSVTFKNESGEVIATLSNGNSTVATGYEQYFFTSEVISGSGEYVKIAAVPKSYGVVIEGTGIGRMDVSVSEYIDGQLGETKQYFGVPVSEDSSGCFGENEDDGGDFNLIMDDVAYTEGDYSDIELKDGNKTILYIAIAVIGVVCVGLAVMLLRRKKSRQ